MTALVRMSMVAGQIIMRHRDAGITSERKADKSPVTQADRDAEDYLTQELRALAPDVQIIGEEACAAGLPAHIDDCFFLIDPLDGTREFIAGGKDFTVNIGLINQSQPIAGVIYAPAHEDLFFSGVDCAYRTRLSPTADFDLSSALALTTRPPAGALRVLASRSHRSPETDAFIADLDVAAFVPASSSYKFCLLAAGEADLYPRHGRTMEWDTAAGHAIIAAAGGSVCRTDDTPLDYGKKSMNLANPSFIAAAHKDWQNASDS